MGTLLLFFGTKEIIYFQVIRLLIAKIEKNGRKILFMIFFSLLWKQVTRDMIFSKKSAKN